MSSRLGVLALAVVVLAAGGVAYATIPDAGGVIRACYTPSIGPGALRVIDTGKGQHCRANEHALSWSQTGPSGPSGPGGASGPSGPAGTAGPTSLRSGSPAGGIPEAGVDVITHTVTPAEAGLTIMTMTTRYRDLNGTTGGSTEVICSLLINGGGSGWDVNVHDNGDASDGDTTGTTLLDRETLATGDEVKVWCSADFGDGGEAGVGVQLLLARVNS